MIARFISRSRVTAMSIAGLLVASVLSATPAAATGGYAPDEYFFDRTSPDGSSVVVKPGEDLTFYSRVTVSEEYAGWPAPAGTKFTRTALVPSAKSMKKLTDYDSANRNWFGYDTEDIDGLNCEYVSVDSAALTLDDATQCINNIQLADSISVANNTASNVTLDTNAGKQVLKRGKTVLSATTTGVYPEALSHVRVDGDSALTIDDANLENYAGATFTLCVNEDLVSAGDILDIETSMTRNSTAISSGDLNLYESDDNDGDSATYTVPEGNPYDQIVRIDLNAPIDTDGTFVATADITDGSSSMLEPCPNATEAGWPSIDTTHGSAGTPVAETVPGLGMTAAMGNLDEDWYNYGNIPDGFGGVFHYGWDGPDAVIANLTPTGGNGDFAGSATFRTDRDNTDNFDIARYGSAGSKLFSLSNRGKGKWSLTTDNLNGGARVVSTIAAAKITALCPAKWTFGGFFSVSAPTDNPVAQGYCYKGQGQKWFIASFTNRLPVILTTLGPNTTATSCSTSSLGVDPTATGSETAIIAYVRQGSRDSEGFCTPIGATTSARTIISVTPSGTVTSSSISSTPWGAGFEPVYLDIQPGSTANTWIGLSYDLESIYDPTTPKSFFTMTSSAITEKGDVDFADAAEFGDYADIGVSSRVNDSTWVLHVSSTFQLDGEDITRASVGTVNPNTGVVTLGSVVEYYGMGLVKSRNRGVFSTDTNGVSRFFQQTGSNSYNVTTWTLP